MWWRFCLSAQPVPKTNWRHSSAGQWAEGRWVDSVRPELEEWTNGFGLMRVARSTVTSCSCRKRVCRGVREDFSPGAVIEQRILKAERNARRYQKLDWGRGWIGLES